MTERFQLMLDWLASLSILNQTTFSQPVPASSDASFRRYYRIEVDSEDGRQTCIVMDAPPEHEDCRPFVRVSQQLEQIGLNVPVVLEQDLHQGFLLLSDLGCRTYLSELSEQSAETLYRDAFQALVTLQSEGKRFDGSLPPYDQTLLTREMALFNDWLGEQHLNLSLNKLEQAAWQQTQSVLIQSALAQPQVYVHRDYHSRNLMITEKHNPGVLDFQDAVKGPLSYDLMSLIRDCYIRWPMEQVKEWQREYFLMLVEKKILSEADWSGFIKSSDFMGIQRHLKAAGIFARLFHRDGKEGYLNDIPTTVGYIVEVGKHYSEMQDLVSWIESKMWRLLTDVNNQTKAV